MIMQNDNTSGLPCPKCGFKIKFKIETLLHHNGIICPSCQLSLNMSVPTPLKVHLQEIAMAERMVRDAQTFSK